ncbi:MAG: hypothetical protein PHX01_00770 [Clostridia bacterium]|nr:hypothetical protein [Clostridia bacterium]
MNCFTPEEIKLYKAGLVEETLWQEITEHLYHCEQCSEVFLTLFSAEEIRQAEDLLSSDFTAKVKTALQEGDLYLHQSASKKRESSVRKRQQEKKQSLFFYYIGAAVVTLIFMSCGVFQKMIDVAPFVASAVEIEQEGVVEREEFRFNLPERTKDFWLDSFVTKEKEGFFDEEKK